MINIGSLVAQMFCFHSCICICTVPELCNNCQLSDLHTHSNRKSLNTLCSARAGSGTAPDSRRRLTALCCDSDLFSCAQQTQKLPHVLQDVLPTKRDAGIRERRRGEMAGPRWCAGEPGPDGLLLCEASAKHAP